ncbi:MAG: RagB/SusD family nutrient uptake outer membrane protein [Paludibacter sp.]|nr:RagB/SusD family nutrient uptake outer membrane protein [Paludibacter sp.]
MKKKNNIIILTLGFILAFLPLGCTEIFEESDLNQAPEQELDFDKVFTDYQQYRQFLDYSYLYMPGHLGRLWNSMVAELSDEAEGLGVNTCSPVFNNGAWSGAQISYGTPQGNARRELEQMWIDLYKGIRQTNMAIAYIDFVKNFPSQEIYNRSLGEAHFIRAFLYFELTKRWGGVPIFDRPLELGVDELDITRSSYETTIEFIVDDCDFAAGLLALEHPESETGRATKGAALALKSRALIYAARPLNNPENDQTKWIAAAEAASEVIKLNHYSLDPDYVNLFFRPNPGTEIIMNRPRTKLNFEQGHIDNSNFWVRFIVPQGYLGWMGTAVSHNFVNLYETANGYPITNPASGYNPDNPYVNRDPRLRMTVLYNDRFWYDRKTEFYIGGLDYGSSLVNPIGYTIAKFWPEAHQRYKGTSAYLNYIFFRYAEILLNYAEAANEAYGPDIAHPGSGITAREVTTQLRQRVGHVPIPIVTSANKEDMRERIINERAVELSFEEHRWYDVLSWKKGVELFGNENPILGMKITKNTNGSFNYEPYIYERRIFLPHMHRYPIPNSEIYKSKVLIQNPGWE